MFWKVSWRDSIGFLSHIHATDSQELLCHKGEFPPWSTNNRLVKSPKKKGGRSNYCPECFRQIKKSIPWLPGMAPENYPQDHQE